MADEAPVDLKPITPEGANADITPKSDAADMSAFMTELQALSDSAGADSSAIAHDPEPAPADQPAETPETPAETPPPPAAPVAPPPAATISEDLIARARQVGIMPDEARMYTPDMLERSVLIFERNLERIQSYIDQPGRQAQAQVPAQQQPAVQQPTATDEFVLNLDEQFHDPDVVAAVRGMHNHYQKQIKDLREIVSKVAPQLETVVQHTQQQAREHFVKQFDAGLDGLGEDYHDLFGKTPQERHGNKDFLQNAHEVLREMNIQSQGFKASGIPVPPMEELQRRAINVLYAGRTQERAKKAAADRVAQQLRDQRGQFIQRPNDAQSLGRKDPKAEALAELSEIIRRDNSSNVRY